MYSYFDVNSSQKSVNIVFFNTSLSIILIYRIFRPIICTFFPKKCEVNSTCALCAQCLYHFQNYNFPYIYYKTPSISNVCEWVRNSWQQVKSETTLKSLKYVALAIHWVEINMTFLKKVTH